MTAAPVDRRPEEGRGGSIYDLGYRGYEGPRLGRRAAIWSLLAHSVRTAYGLGRSARSKVMPVGLAVLTVLPALLALGILMLFSILGPAGEAFEAMSPIRYGTLFPIISIVVFLFCAAQAPELFGRDQQLGVLPLYFSRAVGRLDYALARFLGLYLSVLVLVLVPYMVMWIGRVLVSSDLIDGLVEELPSLPSALAVGLVIGAVVASIAAATASLTPRRSYATVAIIAIFLIPNFAASLLVAMETGVFGQMATLLSPADVLDGVNAYLFDTEPENVAALNAGFDGWVYLAAAAAWIAASLAVLARRYQRLAL